MELTSLLLPQFIKPFYSLSINRLKFLLVPEVDLSFLQHFSSKSRQKYGKMNIKFNLEGLIVNSHFFSQINYVLLSSYQQILILPFLLRRFQHLKIICTKLTFELSRIYVKQFHQKIQQSNNSLQQISIQQQFKIEQEYDQLLSSTVNDWKQIYETSQIEKCLEGIITINYYQTYDTEKGVKLIAYPSGKNNGSSMWQIETIITRQKLLFVDEISHHKWRTCQSYPLDRLKSSQQEFGFSSVIFTKQAIQNVSKQVNEEQKILQFMKKIEECLEKRVSVSVFLKDETLFIDLVGFLCEKFEGKFLSLFLSSQTTHEMVTYCNSFVQYLSEVYKKRIYNDPPDFPLVHYCLLKQKGKLFYGGFEQVALKKKLPLKEVVLQNSPLLHFGKSYEKYLDDKGLQWVSNYTKIEEIELESTNNFGNKELNELLQTLQPQKIFSFGQINPSLISYKFDKTPQVANLNIGQIYNFESPVCPVYYTSRNMIDNQISSYSLQNGILEVQSCKQDYLYIPKNFPEVLLNQFITRGIPIMRKDATSLQTEKSLLYLTDNYHLKVQTKSADQLLLIEKSIDKMAHRLKLK